ncbi:nucleoside/nucleotide kinase family protein [Streptomyces sp. NPDC005573]|uniref:nucleoside/nucleotide kinase family protein n=1 Tax=unclassified Streptomyces TaxID=2593676 RepID=UPI0033A75918
MTGRGGGRPAPAGAPATAPLYRLPPLDGLVERAQALAGTRRTLLGIVGEPGAGKSTLAEQLRERLETDWPGLAVTVSMDGFHLAQKVLDARGQSAVKGTIDTFDADGFLALLRRSRTETANSVWWPEFTRELEDPVAGTVEVSPRHRLVVVDGNFLLAERGPWHRVRDELDETWFLDAEPGARRERLARRYMRYGFTPEAARAKAGGVDEDTSALIRSTASRAGLLLSEVG